MKDNLSKILKIKNMEDGKLALYFYGEIVSSSIFAWQEEDQYPESIRHFLDEANGQDINIYINSPGGAIFAAMAIVNMLQRYSGRKTCYVDGIAASAASVIALSCDEIIMPSNTQLMIHRASAICEGNADDFSRFIELLKQCEVGIYEVYKAKLNKGITLDQVRDLVNAESWLTAEEAARYFNITVTDAVVEAAAFADTLGMKKAPEALKKAARKALALEKERLKLLKLRKVD